MVLIASCLSYAPAVLAVLVAVTFDVGASFPGFKESRWYKAVNFMAPILEKLRNPKPTTPAV